MSFEKLLKSAYTCKKLTATLNIAWSQSDQTHHNGQQLQHRQAGIMDKTEPKNQTTRGYSAAHEKLIPVAIAVLVLIAVGMLVLAIGIGIGWIHAG